MVPEVPREMLQLPSPTVPVPTATAALSPAPATTRQPQRVGDIAAHRADAAVGRGAADEAGADGVQLIT